MARFAEARTVIVFDQQGHGRTPDTPRPMSYEQFADDAAALLRALHVERADAMGYSQGGGVAIQLALRHPELVGRLVSLSATFRRDGWYPAVPAAVEDLDATVRPGPLVVRAVLREGRGRPAADHPGAAAGPVRPREPGPVLPAGRTGHPGRPGGRCRGPVAPSGTASVASTAGRRRRRGGRRDGADVHLVRTVNSCLFVAGRQADAADRPMLLRRWHRLDAVRLVAEAIAWIALSGARER